MMELKLIFCGSGEFGLPTLQHLKDLNDVQIVQVVSQPDRPAGRGRMLTPTPVSRLAMEQGLELVRTADINTLRLPPADVMVVIAFGQKIAPHIVDHPRLGSINLHASLLPAYRGAAPINWAIMDGCTHTGNSVIRLAQRMDAGAILAQERVEIGPLQTAGELHDVLASRGPALVERVIRQLADGSAVETPQDESHATVAPKLSRESARLDFHQDAVCLAHRIRGLFPWPGCRVRLLRANGQEVMQLTLARTQALPSNAGQPPGVIGSDGTVSCGRGSLRIIELVPQGRRLMRLEDFRNARPWTVGMKLESIL